MKISSRQKGFTRRTFVKGVAGGVLLSYLNPLSRFASAAEPDPVSKLFWVKDIPNQPFLSGGAGNYHAGVELLLNLMGENGLKFYRSSQETTLSGPDGMIQSNDVVLIKVNAQWKYRGCTNSDLIRGLVQRILDGHPDGFNGEVVIFENGQGRGSLNCDTTGGGGYPDGNVHANANNESHSFLYLVNTIFNDSRVSCFLLDPIRSRFIGASDHITNGYRLYEDVSYPCFTTTGKGYRVELREGIWQGSGYNQNLKLINVPILKHHDTGGSEITASLKHFYGVLSMSDGQSYYRHYGGLGNTCGKMMVSVRTPVLNIIDAIWVSYSSLSGYPASTTFRTNQILASQDPVALDYWGAKYILYPVNNNPRHHPDFAGINQWLTDAEQIINVRGGLFDPEAGIMVDMVTKSETKMMTIAGRVEPQNPVILLSPNGGETIDTGTVFPITWMNQSQVATVNIFYSLTGADPWEVIASNVTASPGSFNWSVPTSIITTCPNCKVMIKAFDVNGIQLGVDTSDGYFTIRGGSTTPGITVTSPDGGETWPPGTTQTIRWTYTGDLGAYVKIVLQKNGVFNRNITKSTSIGSGGNGSYNWNILSTQTPGADYKVRVVSTSDSSYQDISNNYFTIGSATTYSISGRVATSGGTGISSVTMTLSGAGSGTTSTDGSGNYSFSGLSNGSYTVTPSKTGYTFSPTSRNIPVSGANVTGQDFTGAPTAASITVTAPNGGESWQRGTSHTISWTYTGDPGPYVKIVLVKGGVNNLVITSSTSIGSGGNGSYNWTVPASQATGTDYKIRVVSTTDNTYKDVSNTVFTIS